MNWCSLAIFFSIFPGIGIAQQEILLGNPCGTMDSAWLDPLNFTENPAVITNITSSQVGVFVGRYKDIKGLNFLSAGYAMPFKNLSLGLIAFHTGTSGYQENEINLLLAKNLGNVNIGVMCKTELISVQSFGVYKSIQIGVGVTRNFGPLVLGCSIGEIGLKKAEGIAQQFKGFKVSSQCLYRISNLVSVAILGSKQPGQLISIQPAIYYRTGVINCSLGFDSSGGNVFILTGWIFKGYEVKMILGYQPILGLIHGVEFLHK